MAVKPIPDAYHTVTPYLTVEGADKLIQFLKEAFDAQEINLMKRPDGKVAHAEMRIGNSMLMIAEARGEWLARPSTLYLYVNDCDATYKRAISAGAASIAEPATEFYGDRHGGIKDPSDNLWWIATHVEDVPPDEMKRRAEEWSKKQGSK